MSSIFTDKGAPPDDDALATTLGATKADWDALHAELAAVPGAALAWKFYGQKHGWQVKAERKRKALAYLIPHDGSFLGGMALDDHAVERVRTSDLPAALVTAIVEGRKLPEGRGATVEVHGPEDRALVSRLLALKLGG
ncbi:MAG: DUF3788 family protein [Deltaproteobacteria bacterium]|nr:MAG: DUF3788 family protein [Deltaproteobacteria bacterium]